MMHHTESTIKVHCTNEYRLFRMINGNRQLNESKIKRILADIGNGIDLLRFCPILVKENGDRLDIIDGQHRFYIARKIGSKVWYILAENLSLYDIARMNSNTEKWKAKDFINCYKQLGNNNYKILEEVIEKYAVPVTTAISLLQSGRVHDGGGTKNKFERGEFLVTHQGFTIELLELCIQFKFEYKFQRQFIKAMIEVVKNKKIKVDELIAKVNEANGEMKSHEDHKGYLTNMENIFNKGKKIRVVIY